VVARSTAERNRFVGQEGSYRSGKGAKIKMKKNVRSSAVVGNKSLKGPQKTTGIEEMHVGGGGGLDHLGLSRQDKRKERNDQQGGYDYWYSLLCSEGKDGVEGLTRQLGSRKEDKE